ncbi:MULTISPECIES: NAD(P)H-binding protein [Nocardiaceae]|uniref:NAD(P)H azoreductase n=1 Tax=Rhodococcoides fascians TaxID=1828 RepID=A0A143QGT7_RHOFA|nr:MULTISPECIES: NAD(P)H-binding protein [Rhodococcus]AMY22373.1 NAD(P)H azoreductase [Rhodococcus fascians]KMJ51698.1 oxidoreductase [Rhodococcus fascians]MBX5331687.1 NAD(P)H-binding protein [Rhodococcus fascians]MBY4058840.1 NAD(P)H-binding protein [Rhodococcus fascians]MBY4067692.1 NAD(P)H-binding protein [Rhodococcus fascians]
MSDVLVLGSTGTTGSRVTQLLHERGAQYRAASRTPTSADQIEFDWLDHGTHAAALDGVRAVYLVAPVGVADPLPLVRKFLKQALQQGVRRVVALSSSALDRGAPGLGKIHDAVATEIPEWAVLRPSWFMQNFRGSSALAAGVSAGETVSATGDGRIGFVDAGDIAAVAVHALLDEQSHNTDHIITGPEALSYSDAARIIANHTGKPLRHKSISVDELAQLHIDGGLPPEYAPILAALDAAIATGSEDRVTDVVARIAGRAPRSFEHFVAGTFPPFGRSPGRRP